VVEVKLPPSFAGLHEAGQRVLEAEAAAHHVGKAALDLLAVANHKDHGALGALLDGELHLLALFEGLEAFALDGGEVDEHVVPAVAADEAVALGVVEPLDRADDALRHCLICLLLAKKNKGC